MPQESDPLRFVFITPCVDEAFFEPVKRGMRDAAAALRVSCEFTGTPEVDIPAQLALIRRAVDQGYAGIALSICEATAFNDAVADALGAGVAVVAFNIDERSGGNPRLAGISQNFRAAGRKLGAQLTDRIEPGGTVLLTKHSDQVPALEARIAGIQEALATAGVATRTIVSGMFADEAANRIGAELSGGGYAAIIATGQADTEGAGLSVEALPRARHVPVVGFDLSNAILRLIRDGVVHCTVDQQPYLQGYYPLLQLVQHVRYGLMPADIDAGAALVTAENAERVMALCAQGVR